jgi:hypothetical protein
VEKYCRAGQGTDDSMAHAHCMLVTTNTNPEYVILTAFPLQQWLYERASMIGCPILIFTQNIQEISRRFIGIVNSVSTMGARRNTCFNFAPR